MNLAKKMLATAASAALLAAPTASFASSSQAGVARVASTSGSAVLVRDGRTTPLAQGATVRPGDSIVTGAGSVRLAYNAGCFSSVGATSVVKVAGGCAGATHKPRNYVQMGRGGGGQGNAQGEPQRGGGIPRGLLIAGGLAVGLAIAIIATDGSNSRLQVSP